MRCAVCGEAEGHVVHREHAFDAAIPASKVREAFDSLITGLYDDWATDEPEFAVIERIERARDAILGSEPPEPMIPWSKVKEIHNEGKIVGRLKIMHRLAVLLREYAGGAK